MTRAPAVGRGTYTRRGNERGKREGTDKAVFRVTVLPLSDLDRDEDPTVLRLRHCAVGSPPRVAVLGGEGRSIISGRLWIWGL